MQKPLLKPGLEFAFRMRLEFGGDARLRFQPALTGFLRGFVAVQGGAIEGPRLSGRIVSHSRDDCWRSMSPSITRAPPWAK